MGFGLSVILLIGLRFVGIFLALALARLAHRPWLGLRFVQAPLPAQYVADSQRPGPPQSPPAWPVAAQVPENLHCASNTSALQLGAPTL